MARPAAPALGDLDNAVKAILDTVAGYGPPRSYLHSPAIEENWINAPRIASQVLLRRHASNARV